MRNLRISYQPKNGRIPSAPATQRLMHLGEPFSGQFLRFDLQSGRSAFLFPIHDIHGGRLFGELSQRGNGRVSKIGGGGGRASVRVWVSEPDAPRVVSPGS